MTSKPDFKVMVLLLVFMQLTRDLFSIAKFLFLYGLSSLGSVTSLAFSKNLHYVSDLCVRFFAISSKMFSGETLRSMISLWLSNTLE